MSNPLRSLSLLLLLTTGAQAADEVRTVPSGKNQRIDFLASVNPDCSSPGVPTVRLLEGPGNGVLTTDKAMDFKAFPRSNLRARCNRKRVRGLKLFYQSATEFFGTDRVRLLVITASGDEREATYLIKVR